MSVARWLGWLTAALLLLMLVTGYGITEFRTVTSLSLGALSKPISQYLHLLLGVPLLIALALHVFASSRARRGR